MCTVQYNSDYPIIHRMCTVQYNSDCLTTHRVHAPFNNDTIPYHTLCTCTVPLNSNYMCMYGLTIVTVACGHND